MAVSRSAVLLLVGLLVLGACSSTGPEPAETTTTAVVTAAPPPTATTTTTAALPPPVIDPNGSYAVVAFTNHLPDLGTDEEGAAARPWARLQTTRNYLTMTRLIAEYEAKIVLTYSPILLEQIAATAAGAWDQAARLTAKAATELTAEDRDYIDEVFFQASPAQIDRFPRYRELADRQASGRTLTSAEYRDLQALFNLAWSSPLLLEQEPLLSLAVKGRGFSEEDKALILETHVKALDEFLGALRELADDGLVEVATTPLTNPNLPLLVASRMEDDATEQILRGRARAAEVLGRAPAGLVPYGGLIDQANMPALGTAGYRWMIVASDEPAQPARLTSEAADVLALPSSSELDKQIAQSYFILDPNAAALDAVRRLATSVGGISGGAAIFAVDGTEPWGRYEDGGVAFLRSLFRQLSEASSFATALPSELVSALPFDPGPNPAPPSDLLTEPKELAAWSHLGETHLQLLRSRDIGTVPESSLEAAYELVLEAEGNDWYRWYGVERASGDDAFYDRLFRAKLSRVWDLLGEDPPAWTRVPLYDAGPIRPARQNQPAVASITIDNRISDSEWAQAGQYDERTSDLVRRLRYTFDDTNLYVRIDFTREVLGDRSPGLDLYLGGPGAAGSALTPLGNSIGFDADRVTSWRAANPVRMSAPQPHPARTTTDEEVVVGFNGNSIEFAIELEKIEPGMRPGDQIDFRVFDVTRGPEGGAFPEGGRGAFEIPNLEHGVELASFSDRLRDDHGPGTYTYVTDREVGAGTYDLAEFSVRRVEGSGEVETAASREFQFEIVFREPLTNPWNAPAGFSHQTVDVYIDTNPGSSSGSVRLLPGRVAAIEQGAGWDYAFTVDGWDGTQYSASASGEVAALTTPLEYAILGDRRTILVTVDADALPTGDETLWRYGVAVLANQAIPTLGIHELRPLAVNPDRFRLGGGTGAVNDPMIIDLLHPDADRQEELLNPPRPVFNGDPDTISINSLGRLPLLPG